MQRPTTFSVLVLTACCSLGSRAISQWIDTATAATYSDSRDGDALLVWSGGKLVFEHYSNGYDKTVPHVLASGTKSFSGVLAAMAVRDGLLKSLDEKLADVLPEWRNDANKSRITYRQLLSLSSGIDGGENGKVPTYVEAIQAPTLAPPGQRFSYGPNPFQIFGEALKRKLAPSRRSVADYIQASILNPLGINVGFWRNFANGEPNLPSGAYLLAAEWGKFGDFLRRRGVVGTQRLLDEALLDECLRVASTNDDYRLTFWGLSPDEAGPPDVFFAAGAGKQRLYVLREFGLVVVRFGNTLGAWSDPDFLAALLPAYAGVFADGCAGSRGRATIQANKAPLLGTSDFALRITGALPRAPGVFILGASRERWLGVPLPIDFGPAGMPSCLLHVSPDIMLGFVADASGRATLPAPIGAAARIAGKYVFVQAMLYDAAANAAGYTFADAAVVRIGAR